MRKIDTDPSCRLPLSSKGYEWFRVLDAVIKGKKKFSEDEMDKLGEDLHGNFKSVPTIREQEKHLSHIEKGSFYRLRSPDLDCIFWQRTQRNFEVVRVFCTQDRKIMLLNPKIYR